MQNKFTCILAALLSFAILFSSEVKTDELVNSKKFILKYSPIESSPPVIVECFADSGNGIVYDGKVYDRGDSADIFLLKLGVRQPENIKTEEEKNRLLGNLYIWYPHILSDEEISLLSGRNRKSELFRITRLLSEIQINMINDIKNAANQTSLCISLGILFPLACYPGTFTDGIYLWISSFIILPMTFIAEGVNLLLTKPIKRFFVTNEIKRKTGALNKEIDAIFEEMNAFEKGPERDDFLRKKSLELKNKYFYEENKYFSVY